MTVQPPNAMPTFATKLQDETGSEVVEFGLVILPLLAVVFFIIDISWLFFAQASLQHAVQQGVRYAVTGRSDSSVKSIVQQGAMGFLDGMDGLSKISIKYYSPSNLSAPLNGPGSNAGGNLVEVDVNGVTVAAMAPVWRDGVAAAVLSANSSDVMESSPGGVPPR